MNFVLTVLKKAVNIQNELDNLKRDRIYTAQEKTERETKLKAELAAAKAVEEKQGPDQQADR